MSVHRVGCAIFRGDRLIGSMDTAEDAALVVEALNARERVLAGGGTSEGSPRKDLVQSPVVT